MTLNLLFICSQNQWHSPTAESIYRNDSRVKVRSAGTNSSARKRVTENDLSWSDLILVMENKHKKAIVNKYRHLDLPAIFVLDIPDDYQYMSSELITIIKMSTEDILLQYLS